MPFERVWFCWIDTAPAGNWTKRPSRIKFDEIFQNNHEKAAFIHARRFTQPTIWHNVTGQTDGPRCKKLKFMSTLKMTKNGSA